MHDLVVTIAAIAGTIAAYLLAVKLYQRFYTPLLLPVAIATLLLIFVLLIFDVSYETYMTGGRWIDALLGPAVVALAYPLFQNRDILKRLLLPIIFGTLAGALTGIATGVWLAKRFGFSEEILYSITPKSVTTPVAMDISDSLSGISSLSAVFVMIAGISGAMLSTYVFKLLQLNTAVGCGVGMGSASHAIGTAKAFENGLNQGSVSTIAMIVSALFVSVLAPMMLIILV